jgi:hypothetical protein
MRTYLEHPEKRLFWELKLDVDETVLKARTGNIGEEGISEEIGDKECMSVFGAPPVQAFEAFIEAKKREGFRVILDPVDLLKQIEEANELKFSGRIELFYRSGEVLRYQEKYHKEFDCFVDFDSVVVRRVPREPFRPGLVFFAGMVDEKGNRERQNWIGFDCKDPKGPVYDLRTSGFEEKVYDDLDAFLKDFKE